MPETNDDTFESETKNIDVSNSNDFGIWQEGQSLLKKSTLDSTPTTGSGKISTKANDSASKSNFSV